MKRFLPPIKKTPLKDEIRTDSPIEDIFARFAERADAAFLNSSLESDAGRYAFIGTEPFLALTGKGDELRLRAGGQERILKGDPFGCLDAIVRTYRTDNCDDVPFTAGGIGYLSYDLKNFLERLPSKAEDDLGLPDIYFVFYRVILMYDRKDPGRLLVNALEMDGPGHEKASVLVGRIKQVIERGPAAPDTFSGEAGEPQFRSNFSKEDYILAVERAMEHIRAGDIYQACLSQRFRTSWDGPPYELYRELNRINPAPFSAYLNFGPARVISSSPELFLRMRGDAVETRPMKGTRPRGATEPEDTRMREDLAESPKDTAELAMIVDLERNDLGRIAVPGTVEVSEHRRIEAYPTVFQTIAVVRGRAVPGAGPVDVIKAAFPGGSISGCPKIRAMEIIDELEPVARGVYTGAIGYISFHGTMDMNIAIRTMVMKGEDVYFHVGGGIVADSDPEAEYEETLVKARALVRSLSAPGTEKHAAQA